MDVGNIFIEKPNTNFNNVIDNTVKPLNLNSNISVNNTKSSIITSPANVVGNYTEKMDLTLGNVVDSSSLPDIDVVITPNQTVNNSSSIDGATSLNVTDTTNYNSVTNNEVNLQPNNSLNTNNIVEFNNSNGSVINSNNINVNDEQLSVGSNLNSNVDLNVQNVGNTKNFNDGSISSNNMNINSFSNSQVDNVIGNLDNQEINIEEVDAALNDYVKDYIPLDTNNVEVNNNSVVNNEQVVSNVEKVEKVVDPSIVTEQQKEEITKKVEKMIEEANKLEGYGLSDIKNTFPYNESYDFGGEWCSWFCWNMYYSQGLIDEASWYDSYTHTDELTYASGWIFMGDDAYNGYYEIRENDSVVGDINYVPKPGDLVLFKWDGDGSHRASHVGMVTGVGDGMITTVEGNSYPDYMVNVKEHYIDAGASKYIGDVPAGQIVGYYSLEKALESRNK